MPSFIPIDNELIQIGDLATEQMRDISEAVLSFDVSLTMDGSSELTLEVLDVNFNFGKANYFQVRRDVFYQDLIFEIAAVEVERSESVHPMYRLSCRNKNVQMMKRDKSPEAYRGTSASDYARTVAKRFNMEVVVEETAKKQSIVKGRSGKADESVWDVLQRSANDAQFVCFEINNILFFCSEQFLMGKWGDPNYKFGTSSFVPYGWPEPSEEVFPGASNKYLLLDIPNVRKSDDDPMEADGTMVVERTNGRLLRPGMTLCLVGIPDFENFYLITGVEFSEGVPDPVQITFRSPVKPEEEQTKSTGGGQGTSNSSTSSNIPIDIVNKIRDYVNRNYPRSEFTNADSFATKVKAAGDEVVARATFIWYNVKTVEQQNALITQYGQSLAGGTGNVRYKALNHVRVLLRNNTALGVATALTAGLPVGVTRSITNYANQLGYTTQAREQFIATARVDANRIYKSTTVAQANKWFNDFKTKYGANSPQYLVLLRVKSQITKQSTPALDLNFPRLGNVNIR